MAEQDFDVDRLAAYLHLHPQQVSRLADRGKIPGRKVGGNWRFSGQEIHHWLEERIGVSDEEELVKMEGALERAALPGEDQPIQIAELLRLDAIAVPLEARTKPKVVTAITKLAERTGLLWDAEKMADAVRLREEMYPTALEGGVALLHPRRPLATILAEPFLALGITSTGIPFGGNGMTDIFFLLCSTSDQEHLRTLARLSRMIGDGKLLVDLRQATNSYDAHQLLAEREAELS
jgi:PTS system nitrogen regulatory IIA component